LARCDREPIVAANGKCLAVRMGVCQIPYQKLPFKAPFRFPLVCFPLFGKPSLATTTIPSMSYRRDQHLELSQCLDKHPRLLVNQTRLALRQHWGE